MKKNIFFKIVVIFVVFIACNGSDDNSNNVTPVVPNFSVTEQLNNVFDNGIISQADNFIEAANTFQSLVLSFNTETTQIGLEELQNSWETLKLEWKPLEVLTFGVDFFVTGTITSIDFWPIETEVIDEIIEQNDSIVDLSLLLKSNSRVLGLAAIEYVLFENNLEAFTNQEFSANRVAFLLAQANYIVDEANDYKNVQLENEEGFKAATARSVTGTRNFLFNEVVFNLDEISNLKIGEALGVNTGMPNVDSTEAPYSEFSIDIIEREIQQAEAIFTGAFNKNATDDGFYKELKYLGREDLVEEVSSRFETVYTQLNGINNSLEQQIINDNSQVFNLRSAINELEIIVRVDVQSALDIILTFSDTDGD